jgi:hypothetical protein
MQRLLVFALVLRSGGCFGRFIKSISLRRRRLDSIWPADEAVKLMTNDTDELVLMFMGDTQCKSMRGFGVISLCLDHFPCTSSNNPCKDASQAFRIKNDLNRVRVGRNKGFGISKEF